MSRGAVCAVVLLVIAIADFSSAGLLLANQTLELDISCRAEKRTKITCNNATVIDLENVLITHLNDDINSRVPDEDCAFSLAGSTTCTEDSVDFSIVLICHGSRADGTLVDHVEQQKMAITKIMDRRTSEPFTSGSSMAICRLFRNSDREETSSAVCNEDCIKEYQGPVAVCDCPFVTVPEPSCNVPAVLVNITKVTTVNTSSCDQVDARVHSTISQQISAFVSPITFQGLLFQLAPDSISTSFQCSSSSGLVHLNTLTSLIVNVNTPFCSNNITCIREFNAQQFSVVRQFFLLTSLFIPQMQSVSVGGVQINDSKPNVNTRLYCENGTTLNADGACCFPGCSLCNDRAAIAVVLAVHFDVSPLSSASCSQLDFTEVINSTKRRINFGARLVGQAGGRLASCGDPYVNCTETGGGVTGISVRVPLQLTLAPGVVVNSQNELIALITSTIKGLIEGETASVGGGYNITSNAFTPEITDECTFTPDPPAPRQCPAGSYIKDGVCQLCPISQYTEEADQTQCHDCPNGLTTNRKGATGITDCVGPCPKGHYSESGRTPCIPCPIGTHQGRTGQTSCISCPPGYITMKPASTSFLQCSVTSTTAPPSTTSPPTTPQTYPTVTISSAGGFFASPNYPKNYTVLEKRTWTFQCPFSNQSAGIFILDLCLGSGDSLILQNSRMDGPKQISLPLPMMFNTRGISITFNSDARSTCRGFRIAAGCYPTQFDKFTNDVAFDCDVRKHVKNSSDEVITKILQLLRGEIPITQIGTDPDFAPIYKVYVSGSNKCVNIQ